MFRALLSASFFPIISLAKCGRLGLFLFCEVVIWLVPSLARILRTSSDEQSSVTNHLNLNQDLQSSKGYHQATTYKLPQELTDKIIDSIDSTVLDGRSSLVACSQVNSSWRKQSQKKLFSSVRFAKESRVKAWNLIVSQNGELSSYVRRLNWRFPPEGFHKIEFYGHFSNLQRLSISHLSLHSISDAEIMRLFGPLGHSLQSLDISYLDVNPRKWCLLISLLPHLQLLVLFDVSMTEQLAHGEADSPLSTFAGHIGYYTPDTASFFRWVAQSRPCFRGITAIAISSTLVPTLNLVVKSCSATLNTMTLLSFNGEWGQANWDLRSLDLSPCNDLQTLAIHRDLANPTNLRAILDTVSSKRFEKLVISPMICRKLPDKYDQIFYSFAMRLRELGAVKPLKIAVEIAMKDEYTEEWIELESRVAFPLSFGLGVIVPESGWKWYL